MELKRAKEVLDGMQIEINLTHLTSGGQDYFYVLVFPHQASFDAKFDNPDQLIAIATWMRDPEGVVKA